MAGAQHLLRKAAIEKMSSPEQLDTLMKVTSPAGWVALLAVGSIVIAGVVWSVVAMLNVKIDGMGILLRGDTVKTVQVSAAGTVQDLLVSEGEIVEIGQVIAHVNLPEIVREIASLTDRLGDLEGQEANQSAQMRSLKASYQTQLRDLQAQLRTKKSLHERGLARRQDVLAIEGRIGSVRAQMLQSELGQTGRGNIVEDTRRQIEKLQKQLDGNSVIKSPFEGRVAGVFSGPGEMVTAGSRLINLESADEPFHVLVFIPFTEGKRVRKDMEVRISPSNVKPEEFGFIIGRVESVSSQPVTPEEVRRTLNNDQLAQKFAKDTPFRVRVTPLLDPNSPSGFKWTSATGPPIAISSSTPCSAQVIVEERKPISYVIPMAKKALGMT